VRNKLGFLFFVLLIQFTSLAQEGIPVYSDYLTDNYYLLHPSMAGASNCDKLRITGRKQWFGQEDAPELQTASFNMRLDEKSGAGIILFNDKNGYHSQKGVKLTYAHHIMFSRDDIDLNQLSFGMSAGFIQNQLDETTFTDFDPIIFGQVQKSSYFNADFGVSYNFLNFYVHATVLGALDVKRSLYSDYESPNLRRYIFSTGHAFGDKQTILWEPSILFQMIDATKEKLVDLNIKAQKQFALGEGTIWGGFSYRRSFEGAQYLNGTGVSSQKLQYLTPFFGVTYKQFMVAYTYSKVSGPILFDQGAYHQITLGFNFNCKQEYYIGTTL
jgi:type IX secretion system PorP/SprF family membrane protein